MTRYVLDASVAVKWYLRPDEEPLADVARKLLAREVAGVLRFIVPDLFFAEFANTFRKAERQGRCDTRTSDRALDYLALATETGAALITADERLVQAAGAAPVRWLGVFR